MSLTSWIWLRRVSLVDCANELFNAARLCPGSHCIKYVISILNPSKKPVNPHWLNRMLLNALLIDTPLTDRQLQGRCCCESYIPPQRSLALISFTTQVCSLNPSNDYKTVRICSHGAVFYAHAAQSVLSGLTPSIILEICSRYASKILTSCVVIII